MIPNTKTQWVNLLVEFVEEHRKMFPRDHRDLDGIVLDYLNFLVEYGYIGKDPDGRYVLPPRRT